MLLFYDVAFDNETSEETIEKFKAMYAIADLQLFVDYNRNLSAAGTADDPAFSKEYSWKHIDMAHQQRNLYLGSEGNVAHYCFDRRVAGGAECGARSRR